MNRSTAVFATFAVLAVVAACADGVVAPSGSTARARGVTAGFSPAYGEGTEASGRASIDMQAEREALLAADRAWAAATGGGLLSGFPSALAGDVVVNWPGQPIIQGSTTVIAFLSSLPDASGQTMTWYPVRVDVSSDGTRGYTYGYGQRVLPAAGGGTATSYIKYITFWRRSGSGSWRVAAWNLGRGTAGAPSSAPAGCESPDYGQYVYFPNTDEVAEEDLLKRTDDDFSASSMAQGGASSFGAYVADDGAVLSGGTSVICGRDAVAAANAYPPGFLSWQALIADAAPTGDLGFTAGPYVVRVTNADGSITPFYGKYITVWKKQRTGEWRFVVDGGNASPAP